MMKKIMYLVAIVFAVFAIAFSTVAADDVETDLVGKDDTHLPIQYRIALTPDGMTVSWSTIGNITGKPKVRYGKSVFTLEMTAEGFSLWYDPSITVFHHVVLPTLDRSTRYYWQVVLEDKIASPILDFYTAPEPGTHEPHRMAIYGDFGEGNFDATIQSLRQIKDSFDLVWHIGDLAYADDYDRLNSTYEKVQEKWMNAMADGYWSDIPYMFTPGNHEASCNHDNDCPIGQQNFTSYRYRYRMPFEESGSTSQLFYSFDYGLVHYISLDTEVDYPDAPEGPGTKKNCGPFGDQLTWLKQDLEKAVANRDNIPWIFVGGHRPYYAAGATDSYMNTSSAAFENLLNQYQVDAVFWGHIHRTERMWPIAPGGVVPQKNYINAPNPIYFITASVGNIEGLSKVEKKEYHDYTAFADGEHFGVGLIDVFNATTIRWQFVESTTLEILDEAYIYKDPVKTTSTF